MRQVKRLFGVLIVFVLAFYLFSGVIVIANSNGVGTIQDTYQRTIVPGATYTYAASNNGSPQKNYVLEYNPKNTEVEALTVFGTHIFGGDTLSSNVALAESRGYTVVAGINGGPFDTSNGVTIGTIISNGRIISASEGLSGYDSFAIRGDGSMFISTSNLSFTYSVGGKVININHINKQKKEANNYVYLITSDYSSDTTTLASSTEVVLNVKSGRASIGEKMIATVESVNNNTKRTKLSEGQIVLVGPNAEALGNLSVGAELTFDFISNDKEYDWNEVEQSICGFYEILKDGEYVNTWDPAIHPRTTIGYKADGTIVFFVVDGRQPGFSIGLTDLACAQYMKSLGCVAAIRMDGGGSSTMGIRMPGDSKMTTVNSPSDGSERSDADGLLLVLKEDYDQNVGADTLLHAYPSKLSLLENTEIDITVKATDANYNPKETPEYSLSVEGEVGSITSDNKFKAKEGVGTGRVKVTSASASTYVDVSVTDQVDELYAGVNNLALAPGEKVNLSVKAFYNNSLLTCSNESFTWACPDYLGTVSEDGVYTATSTADVSGEITISYGDVQATVKITIGQLPKVITGFENARIGTSSGQWRNSQMGGGSCDLSVNGDLEYVKFGYRSLRIDFKLAGTTGTVGAQIHNGSNIKIDGTPTAIGMWVYATPNAAGAWMRMQYNDSGSTGAKYADFGTIDWVGWKYLEAPIDTSVSYPISIQYLVRIMAVNESERINGTIFVDQLRAVYGFTNDDFDSPVIKNLVPNENGVTLTTTQTVSCDITDTDSGVSQKNTLFYLDGKKVSNIVFTNITDGFRLSWTPSALVPLKKGKHTIKVRAEDNFGNFSVKEWNIVVDDSLPEFGFEFNKNVFVLEESELFFSSSNDAFSEYVLNLRYNSDQVVISDVISSGMHNASIEKNENGELNIVVKKNTSGSEIGGIKIVYKTLVDGEVNIEVLKFAFKNKNYNIELMPALESIVLTSEFNYDFNVFVSLVNNVDKDNLLSDLSDFNLVLKEMNKFNRDKVTDEAVLDKLAYIDSCIEMYEDILNSLQAVKEDSSVVGALLGGR